MLYPRDIYIYMGLRLLDSEGPREYRHAPARV